MKRLLPVLSLLLLLPGCHPGSKPPAKTSVERIGDCELHEPWQIQFADGSANVTTFSQEAGRLSVRHDPVTRAESSSGVYDGGKPYAGSVPDVDRQRILGKIRQLADDPGLRVERREKGTGQFTIVGVDGKDCRFLIARGAQIDAFAQFLRKEIFRTEQTPGGSREPD